MIEAARIAEVMGGRAVLGRPVKSLHQLSETVARGLPKAALRQTVHRVFSVPRKANAIMYQIVPEATYKRRKSRLHPRESERTERLARVIAAAEDALGDREDAREWLIRRHPELGGQAPIHCALTELGAREVEELLDRLQYGIAP